MSPMDGKGYAKFSETSISGLVLNYLLVSSFFASSSSSLSSSNFSLTSSSSSLNSSENLGEFYSNALLLLAPFPCITSKFCEKRPRTAGRHWSRTFSLYSFLLTFSAFRTRLTIHKRVSGSCWAIKRPPGLSLRCSYAMRFSWLYFSWFTIIWWYSWLWRL